MTRENDGGARRNLVAQDRAHDIDAHRVEAGEGLVEHEQIRRMHESAGQLHALLVAERELLDPVLGPLIEAEPCDPRLGRPGASASCMPVILAR